MEYKYTDYCTGFYVEKNEKDKIIKEVWFWDEVKDNRIKKVKVKNKEEADKILKEWEENAPNHCICEIL